MFNPRANFLRGVWSTVVNLNTYLLCLSALRAVPVPSAGKNCIQLRYLPGKQRLGMGHLTSYYSLPCQTASKFSKFKLLPHTPRKNPKYDDRIFNLNLCKSMKTRKLLQTCLFAYNTRLFWFWSTVYISKFNKFQGSVPPKCQETETLGAIAAAAHVDLASGPGLIRGGEGLSHGNPRGLAHTSYATLTLAPRKYTALLTDELFEGFVGGSVMKIGKFL